MAEKNRILIIGPTFGVGGVRTHVEHSVKLFSTNQFKVKVIKGYTFETFKTYKRFKPHIVIHNLSVYPKQLIRNIVNRSITFCSFAKHILHLHGGRFYELGLLSSLMSMKILTFHFRRYDSIFCLTQEQYLAMLKLSKKTESVQKVFNYVEVPNRKKSFKKDGNLNLLLNLSMTWGGLKKFGIYISGIQIWHNLFC